MTSPRYRVTISSKDGSDRTFTDWNGQEVSKRHEPVGAIFEQSREDGSIRLSFAAEDKGTKPFSFDPETEWLNFFVNDGPRSTAKPAGKPAAKPAGKPAPRRAAKRPAPAKASAPDADLPDFGD